MQIGAIAESHILPCIPQQTHSEEPSPEKEGAFSNLS